MIKAFDKRYFTDSELLQLQRNPEYLSHAKGGDRCPVCLNTGKFIYDGIEYACIDDDYGHVALRLAKLYWLHGVPLEYQQLVWDEWVSETEDEDTKGQLDQYIDLFERYSLNGVGVTLYSKGLGTGKTWAATALLKELIKQGHDGWFAPFYEVKSYYEIVDDAERSYKISRVRDSAVLVLDEIRKPNTVAQRNFMEEHLEDLVRPRSGANLPTIITTNMTPDEMEDTYPRVFSVITAKNLLIELSGSDARLGNKVWKRVAESVANGWALPIT